MKCPFLCWYAFISVLRLHIFIVQSVFLLVALNCCLGSRAADIRVSTFVGGVCDVSYLNLVSFCGWTHRGGLVSSQDPGPLPVPLLHWKRARVTQATHISSQSVHCCLCGDVTAPAGAFPSLPALLTGKVIFGI